MSVGRSMAITSTNLKVVAGLPQVMIRAEGRSARRRSCGQKQGLWRGRWAWTSRFASGGHRDRG
jgi:hypothetical protein